MLIKFEKDIGNLDIAKSACTKKKKLR